MTDNELQNILLQEHYDRRKEGVIEKWYSIDDQEEAKRIIIHLMDKELVKAKIDKYESGLMVVKYAEITSSGIDMIENPKQISSHHTQHINIHSGENFQIGNNNSMNVSNKSQIQILFDAIDRKDAPAEKKQEAKSLLRQAMNNPLLNTMFGAFLSKIDNTNIDHILTYLKTLLG